MPQTIPEVILDCDHGQGVAVLLDIFLFLNFLGVWGGGGELGDQTQATVSFPITVKTNVEGVEVGEGWREEAGRGMVDKHLLVPPPHRRRRPGSP